MLSDKQILEGMRSGKILINPFTLQQLGPNSYDVRLANIFVVVETGPKYFGPIVISTFRPGIRIPFGWTILGRTIETIGTREHYVAMLRARSSIARTGINIGLGSGLGDIGYCSPWTMAMSCTCMDGQYITTNSPVAQMIFFDTGEPIAEYSGQYYGKKFADDKLEMDPWMNMVPKEYRDRILPPEARHKRAILPNFTLE